MNPGPGPLLPPEERGAVAWAITHPVSVTVGVLLIALFGLQALFAVPIQLTPDIHRPVLAVETIWPGANPQEVEREIVEPQEKVLKNVEGLVSMSSEISPGVSRILLEFAPGTVLDAAMFKANNALNKVGAYPAEADRPVIAPGGEREEAIGWFVLIPTGEALRRPMHSYLDLMEDEVKPLLERVPGVASANIFGGREEQVEVRVDPRAVAARQLTLRQIADRLAQEDRDVSAGHLDEGKRRYVLRTVGAFDDPADIARIVIREEPTERVLLSDVATVERTYKDAQLAVRHKGRPSIAMSISKRTGSNVLEVMSGVQQAVAELDRGLLAREGLELVQAYDSTTYIRDALVGVQKNIVLGSLLAVIVLLFFLRSVVPTVIIALAIPISSVGTFLAMFSLGRNINVVSLAGLSFAIGMLVDNSIVVLESIVSRVEKGEDPATASIEGTKDVWGAVLASTLTTVAVFLPLFFLEAEIAELFRDIAVAIACAVSLSFVVSVLVIPTMTARWMAARDAGHSGATRSGLLARFVHRICGSVIARVVLIVGLTAASVGGSWWLRPPAEYLPPGNQNFLFGILIPPSGYNVEEFERIGQAIESELEPLWTGPDAAIDHFFYVAFGRQVIMGVSAGAGSSIGALKGPVHQALSKIPGMIAIVIQPGLFDRGLAGGRSIDLKLQGPDLATLVELAQHTFFAVRQELEGAQVQPIPGLDLGQPEIRLVPDRVRLAEVGLSASELGFILDVLADGARVSELRRSDGRTLDLMLRGDPRVLRHTQDLAGLPIYLPAGGLLPLEALGSLVATMGPDQIHHFERERAITLRINPPPAMPLEEAMTRVREKVVAGLEAQGRLVGGYRVRMAGTADKLTATREALSGQFLVAVLVTYLLLASLLESFLYPFVILFSVPLAGLGGFLALRGVDRLLAPQSLDVLTMLGFILLVGIVVNNAILLVDRALINLRGTGLSIRDAVTEAVGSRVRPILMSTLTSVFGMAPLVLMTGPGSELYRGIGAVVVGGLLCSTVFTLLLIPALLSLVLQIRRRIAPGRE